MKGTCGGWQYELMCLRALGLGVGIMSLLASGGVTREQASGAEMSLLLLASGRDTRLGAGEWQGCEVRSRRAARMQGRKRGERWRRWVGSMGSRGFVANRDF